jgi:hypothetical protein
MKKCNIKKCIGNNVFKWKMEKDMCVYGRPQGLAR